ncbi:MAG: DUF4328 domain-containing protein [Bacteroidia bacterium]
MYGINPISPNEERSKTSLLLLRIYLVILFCLLFTEIVAAVILHKNGGNMRESLMVVAAVGIVGALGGIVNILFMVYFIMWLRRAYHNLHKAGSKNLRHSEGWAAGAWFIPIMSFVWPLQIVRDTWIEMQNVFRKQGEFYEREEDTVTGWWWAFFLVALFVGYIGSFNINFKNFEIGYTFSALSHLGYIFSGIMLITVIRKISDMENDMSQRANGYYAWLTQQQAEQYQQQQNEGNMQQQNPFLPENSIQQNPGQPDSNEENNSQDNFYKP